jgi:hypothetical protein
MIDQMDEMDEQPIKLQRDGLYNMLSLAELQLREDKDIPAALETLSALRAQHCKSPPRLARPKGTTLH